MSYGVPTRYQVPVQQDDKCVQLRLRDFRMSARKRAPGRQKEEVPHKPWCVYFTPCHRWVPYLLGRPSRRGPRALARSPAARGRPPARAPPLSRKKKNRARDQRPGAESSHTLARVRYTAGLPLSTTTNWLYVELLESSKLPTHLRPVCQAHRRGIGRLFSLLAVTLASDHQRSHLKRYVTSLLFIMLPL